MSVKELDKCSNCLYCGRLIKASKRRFCNSKCYGKYKWFKISVDADKLLKERKRVREAKRKARKIIKND